jgi:membrane-bound serine protease (ClpP class)
MRFLVALGVIFCALVLSPVLVEPLDADEADSSSRRIVAVIEVSGLIDPIEISYIDSQLEQARSEGVLAIVLQINSPGSTVSETRLKKLLENLENSTIPVGVWIGQSGATAQGGSAHIVSVADFSGIAPGSKIGRYSEVENSLFVTDELRNRRWKGEAAVDFGLVDVVSPTLGEFLLALEDEKIIPKISVEIERADGLIQRGIADDVSITFNKLSLIDQLFHTVASPAVAYLLLLIGLSLILLDFFTGGIGVAGGVGAVSLMLSSYGLGVLDVRIWALIALVVSMFGFAVDLQTGVPRFWTFAGSALLVIGSLFLFGAHTTSWVPLVCGIGLTIFFILSGMPALIRTRYGTSTLGREWMIGEMGVAVTDITPDGIIRFREAQWRARVNRLTPIESGETARIVGIEGVILEVEPEEGAAVDYREMRKTDEP